MKLFRYYTQLKTLNLVFIVKILYSILNKRIIKNLNSCNPNLFLFDLYRLNYFIKYSAVKRKKLCFFSLPIPFFPGSKTIVFLMNNKDPHHSLIYLILLRRSQLCNHQLIMPPGAYYLAPVFRIINTYLRQRCIYIIKKTVTQQKKIIAKAFILKKGYTYPCSNVYCLNNTGEILL